MDGYFDIERRTHPELKMILVTKGGNKHDKNFLWFLLMAVGGIVSVFWGYHQVAGAYPGETDIFRAYFRKLPRGTDYGLIIKDFAKNTSD